MVGRQHAVMPTDIARGGSLLTPFLIEKRPVCCTYFVIFTPKFQPPPLFGGGWGVGVNLQQDIYHITQRWNWAHSVFSVLCTADRASRCNSCKWPTWCTIFFSYMFIPNLYMFRALMCSSSGELIVSIHLVYVTVRRWPSGIQVWVEPKYCSFIH